MVVRRITANAPSARTAETAVVTEMNRRGIDFVTVRTTIAAEQRPDDKVAVVVTKPEGERLTYTVAVTLES